MAGFLAVVFFELDFDFEAFERFEILASVERAEDFFDFDFVSFEDFAFAQLTRLLFDLDPRALFEQRTGGGRHPA